jgi:L-lactate dehydrogenase complex protein LldG
MDIDLPTMLLRVRGGGKKLGQSLDGPRRPQGIPQPVNWGLRLFSWFASGPRRFVFAQKLAAAFSRIWSPRAEWMALPAFTGWGYSKEFPRPVGKTFRDRWVKSRRETRSDITSDQGSENGDQKAESPDHPITQSPSHPNLDQLIDNFQTELETLGGVFIRCDESELAARILAILNEKNIDTVMAWEDDHLPAGLVESLFRQGIRVLYEPDPEIRVGITGATAGIAETGTLVVTSGNGKPQSTSLLPELHIAILRETDLQINLARVLNLHKVRKASVISLISGPSKTADIEMTLTIGVHGPGEVIVFCV